MGRCTAVAPAPAEAETQPPVRRKCFSLNKLSTLRRTNQLRHAEDCTLLCQTEHPMRSLIRFPGVPPSTRRNFTIVPDAQRRLDRRQIQRFRSLVTTILRECGISL